MAKLREGWTFVRLRAAVRGRETMVISMGSTAGRHEGLAVFLEGGDAGNEQYSNKKDEQQRGVQTP